MPDNTDIYQNAHVIIDSVPYELDVGNAQDHYRRWSEPLRPANAQVVVGGDQQRFQLRSDILQFRIEDFSEGAGQYSWDPQRRASLWEIYGCDAFSRPGQIGPGMRFAPQLDDTSPTKLRLGQGKAIPASRRLFYVTDAGPIYEYEPGEWEWRDTGENWTTQITAIDSTYSAVRVVGGTDDELQYLYFLYTSSAAGRPVVMERLNVNTSTWETITDGSDFGGLTATVNTGDFMLSLGDKLIFSLARGRRIYQIADSPGSTPELLYTSGRLFRNYPGESGQIQDSGRMATAINNRVYYVTPFFNTSHVHEIIPQTAASAGSGRVMLELTGLYARAMWGHLGHLFIAGFETTRRAGDDRRAFNGIQTYYIDMVNGVFGTIGNPDYGYRATEEVEGSPFTGGLVTSMFAQAEPRVQEGSSTDPEGSLAVWEVNQLTGGFQAVAYMTGMNGAIASEAEVAANIHGLARFGDVLFLNIENWDTDGLCLGLVPYDNYPGNAAGETLTSEHWFVTPWIDFAISDDKALASVTTVWDRTITSAWQVQIEVQFDSDEAPWIDLDNVDFAPDGSSPVERWIPGPNWFTTARSFSRARFRLTFTLPSGTFDMTEAPWLSSLEVKASVSKKVRSWDLILTLTEETAWGGRAADELIDNLLTLEANDAVFPFVDLYYHGLPDIYTGVDGDSLPTPYVNARLDSLQMVLDRKGQGYAMVRIVEAV